jgi:hypothetical protein
VDNAGWRVGAAALKGADLQRDDTQTRAMRMGGGARGMNCGGGREQGGDRSEHRVGGVSARGRRLDIEGEGKHRQSWSIRVGRATRSQQAVASFVTSATRRQRLGLRSNSQPWQQHTSATCESAVHIAGGGVKGGRGGRGWKGGVDTAITFECTEENAGEFAEEITRHKSGEKRQVDERVDWLERRARRRRVGTHCSVAPRAVALRCT